MVGNARNAGSMNGTLHLDVLCLHTHYDI